MFSTKDQIQTLQILSKFAFKETKNFANKFA